MEMNRNDLSHLLDSEIKEVRKIEKGFSEDIKYFVQTSNGTYLIKQSNIEYKERKLQEFVAHTSAFEKQVKTNTPVSFQEINDSCFSIFTYEKGNDASQILPKLSKRDQYAIGWDAGKELLKIHNVIQDKIQVNWYDYKKIKHEKYWKLYKESTYKIHGDSEIQQFIQENYHLMTNRPITLLHDDYHVNNMICDNNMLAAVIDFGRFDWGDPIHDFYKTGMFSREISIPFCVGLVDGYFNESIPDEFWKLYNLYTAMIIFPSVVWTPHLIDDMLVRIETIIHDHDYFKLSIPSWYSNFLL